MSTVTTKIQIFRNKKKSAKFRLTKAKNQLTELLESSTVKGTLPSKNAVRRAIKKSWVDPGFYMSDLPQLN